MTSEARQRDVVRSPLAHRPGPQRHSARSVDTQHAPSAGEGHDATSSTSSSTLGGAKSPHAHVEPSSARTHRVARHTQVVPSSGQPLSAQQKPRPDVLTSAAVHEDVGVPASLVSRVIEQEQAPSARATQARPGAMPASAPPQAAVQARAHVRSSVEAVS